MIIVLEGSNGVGKSTYAKLLESELGIPCCRPFRGGDTELHWGAKDGSEQELFTKLESYGIPVNTHIDDLYVADFLRTFKMSAILDRSLPSAIVYGTIQRLVPDADVRGMLGYWQGLLKEAWPMVLYVWLKAQHSVAKGRVEGRWSPTKQERQRLDGKYKKIFQSIWLPKIMIDTSVIEVVDGVRRIRTECQALKT